MLSNTATIRISNETKSQLDGLKIHHRETYEDVIRRLIMQAMREIEKE